MAKRKKATKAGLPPGTLIHVGSKLSDSVRITVIDYDAKNFQERQINKIEDCFQFKDTSTVSWINIDGLHDVSIIDAIGARYDLHPLILEDILHTTQRPKIEDYETYIFITLRMFRCDEKQDEITSEQVSIVLGPSYVLSFQERIGDIFDPIRERLRTGAGKARSLGPDYLAYRLIDSIVDNYFGIMDHLGNNLEDLEDDILENPESDLLQQLQDIKKELIQLRRSIFPLREAIGRLEKDETKLIHAKTKRYLRDVYDHTVQIAESIESNRDITAGLKDIYLSSLSNKMNVVMKVLTIIATIFIPLTFIAGIYGMNFKYMPELEWKWGYPAVWAVMIVLAILMLIFFRKKKWL